MNTPPSLATGTIIQDCKAHIGSEASVIMTPAQGAGYGSLAGDLRRDVPDLRPAPHGVPSPFIVNIDIKKEVVN
jgi:hypothetical protein